MLCALDGVDFHAMPGEAVGLVGESGSGKSTLTRLLTGDERPTAGSVRFEGQDVWSGTAAHRAKFRRSVQVVLQNPRSSLDPRMRVGHSLLEPLRSLRIDVDHGRRVAQVLDQVGLGSDALHKYPHEFSGGQLQRIAIARALMPSPSVLIADEPVSALDVSIRAQVLNLLKDLVAELGLTLVLIAHDLSVVAYTTSRVAVMAAGRIVEVGEPLTLFSRPQAGPTKALVDAVLTVEQGLAGTALTR
jgi:peptide/nickel transport system ATP-binding protein